MSEADAPAPVLFAGPRAYANMRAFAVELAIDDDDDDDDDDDADEQADDGADE